MGSFAFNVLGLILSASFLGPHLLVLPGRLMENCRTLSLGGKCPWTSGNLRSFSGSGHKPTAEQSKVSGASHRMDAVDVTKINI